MSAVGRLALTLSVLGILAVAGAARADDPAASCGPVTCVNVHPHAELGCGADGRDPSFCNGDLTYTIAFDSPVPIESMDYSIEVSCSVACAGAGSTTGTCGWMPPEVRPIGETGCSVSELISVGFAVDAPPGSCETYRVAIAVSARAVLDPMAEVADAAEDIVEVCDP
jgi:hypothetical protein